MEQSASEMLRRFVGGGETILRAAELGAGHVNRTWRVETDAGVYICQRLSRDALSGAADAIAYNYLRYAEACAAARDEYPDWTFPRWLRTEDGGVLLRDGAGDVWRAYPMLRGRTYRSGAGLPDGVIRQFARGLAVLHRVLDRYPAPPKTVIPHFHDLAHEYAAFRALTDSARAVPAVNERIERDMRDLARALPLRRDAVVHADTRIGNAIFDGNGRVIAFIDTDTISTGCRLLDVADGVRSVSCVREADGSGRFDRRAYDVFVDALAASPCRTLSDAELDAVPDALLRVSFELGLRYYTDYLRGNVHFRVREPEEALRRAQGQFALTDAIRAAF